jgi:hypothetical protein
MFHIDCLYALHQNHKDSSVLTNLIPIKFADVGNRRTSLRFIRLATSLTNLHRAQADVALASKFCKDQR